MCNCNCKNALSAVTATPISAAINSILPLNTNNLVMGPAIRHTAGTGIINFVRGGLYLVTFNATVATAGTAGNITVKMQRAGTDVPGATASAQSTAATDVESISFTSLVRVSNVCANSNGACAIPIQFVNIGVAATFNNIDVTVTEVK